jgi:LmbE family N-acetylglucosaminyl deacetylase
MHHVRLLAVTTALLLTHLGFAQDLVQLDRGAVGTYLQLKQLQTTGSVLHVVAHPDDEDGALLAYSARGLGARTMLFSITRGEGGANLISSHFFDELGALRTLEHLKAASYYGNQLFYSRGADYGYSKTLQEAMRQWDNGIPLLADLVEVIRREQPTVMLSRFRGDPRDGHGHHQMAGVISRLAYDAAADPQQFPEQLERGLTTWQVTKLYVTAGSPWRNPNEGEWTVAVPTGDFDPLLGKSYAQVARFGLGFQRSQGISGHDGDPGPRNSYYHLEKHLGVANPADSEDSLFDSINTSLSGLVSDEHASRQELAELDHTLSAVSDAWNPRHPEETAPGLIRILARVRALKSNHEADLSQHAVRQLDRKEHQLQQAIATALGLQLAAWASNDDDSLNYATPGEKLRIHIQLANQNRSVDVHIKDIRLHATGEIVDIPSTDKVAGGAVFETTIDTVLTHAEPTRPHWHRPRITQSTYDVQVEGQQRPTPTPPLVLEMTLSIQDQDVDLRTTVEIRNRHPEYGEVRYPLTVVPAMSVSFPLASGVVQRGNSKYELSVVVRNSLTEPSRALVRLELPPEWECEPDHHEADFRRADEESTFKFEVQVPDDVAARQYEVRAVVEHSDNVYREGFQTVTARDLDRLNIYRPASHRVQVADLRMRGTPNVGYITGSGDTVAECMTPFGITPRVLSSADLAAGNLDDFDVILVGVRAYAVREDIRKFNARLLEYVRRGGVLIVQYQTPEFDNNYGPYAYEMGRRPEEVSEEDATVTMLQPDHPVFNSPNKITAADFDGWFEQRGSKFWNSWDHRYVPLLECHDAGQSPQEGGMLLARHGAGVYVYSAYAWYRQLPQGVPGAYRLFANLLSLPETMSAD